MLRPLLQLHAWWHVLSAFGTYTQIVLAAYVSPCQFSSCTDAHESYLNNTVILSLSVYFLLVIVCSLFLSLSLCLFLSLSLSLSLSVSFLMSIVNHITGTDQVRACCRRRTRAGDQEDPHGCPLCACPTRPRSQGSVMWCCSVRCLKTRVLCVPDAPRIVGLSEVRPHARVCLDYALKKRKTRVLLQRAITRRPRAFFCVSFQFPILLPRFYLFLVII